MADRITELAERVDAASVDVDAALERAREALARAEEEAAGLRMAVRCLRRELDLDRDTGHVSAALDGSTDGTD